MSDLLGRWIDWIHEHECVIMFGVTIVSITAIVVIWLWDNPVLLIGAACFAAGFIVSCIGDARASRRSEEAGNSGDASHLSADR